MNKIQTYFGVFACLAKSQFTMDDVTTASGILNEGIELFEKKDLDLNYLPLNTDILSYIYYLKDNSKYHTAFKKLHQPVADKIIGIWSKTEIPILGDKYIKKKIDNLLKFYKKCKRNIRTHKDF